MKKNPLLLCLIVTLAASRLSAEVILEETFESFAEGSELANQSSSWKTGGAGESNVQASAQILAPDGAAGNESKYLAVTPGGGEATTENASVEFPTTGSDLTLEVDVLPRVGTGGILLTTPEGVGQHPVLIQFYGAENTLRAASKKDDDSVEMVEFGKFQLNRWYRVTVKLKFDPASADGGTYEVSVVDLADGVSVGEAKGLRAATPARSVNGVILSATFGAASLYGWDNLRVETTP